MNAQKIKEESWFSMDLDGKLSAESFKKASRINDWILLYFKTYTIVKHICAENLFHLNHLIENLSNT